MRQARRPTKPCTRRRTQPIARSASQRPAAPGSNVFALTRTRLGNAIGFPGHFVSARPTDPNSAPAASRKHRFANPSDAGLFHQVLVDLEIEATVHPGNF